MTHLLDARLDAHLFAAALTPEENVHLEHCADCRARLNAALLLRDELQIARRSQPSAGQMDRYRQLYAKTQSQSLGQRLSALWDRLHPVLVLDTRQSLSGLGLRRAAGFGHRLLYSSELVDVELLLEAEGDIWHIEGDVLPFDPQTLSAPYWVELQARDAADRLPAEAHFAAESEASGRFRLADIPPGRYDLSLTPAQGAAIDIPGLEIL